VWSLVAQLSSIATTTVLARLLSPRDIGLVAAAMVVIGLFEVLTSVGVAATVVQRRITEQRPLATLFWANVGLGLLVAGAASVTAPLAAGVIGEPEASGLIVAVAAVSAFGFLRAVPNAILQRDLRYRAAYGISTAAVVVTSVVSIALAALTDLGPEVIVIGRLCGVALETTADLVAARWRPSAEFDTHMLRENTAFSVGFWATQVTTYGTKNFDYWAVGRTAGAGALGLYYIAYVLPNILRQRVTWVVQGVLFPLLSRIQDDRRRLGEGYLSTVRFLSFVSLPALLGTAAAAGPVIEVFFGERWSGAARPMSILAVAAAVDAPAAAAPTVFLARGRPALSVLVTSARLIVFVPSLVVAVAVSDGLSPVAGAVLVSSVVSSLLWFGLIRREIGVGFAAAAGAMFPFALAATTMAVTVDLLEGALASKPPAAVLPLLVVAGALVYLAVGMAVAPRLFRALSRDVAGIALARRRRRPSVPDDAGP
jgi:O-antigen/teichoic acid export membrane protein